MILSLPALTFYDPVRLKHWPQPHCSNLLITNQQKGTTLGLVSFLFTCILIAALLMTK